MLRLIQPKAQKRLPDGLVDAAPALAPLAALVDQAVEVVLPEARHLRYRISVESSSPGCCRLYSRIILLIHLRLVGSRLAAVLLPLGHHPPPVRDLLALRPAVCIQRFGSTLGAGGALWAGAA